MSNNHKISIIIPTFNRKSMLIRCINSILSGNYDNYEIIISDDHSSDGTDKIISKYLKNKKIKYLRNKEEKLLSYTINKAIRLCSGEFILILDDDNVLDKNCLKYLATSLENNNVGAVGPISLYYSKKNIIMNAGVKRSIFMRRAIYPYQNQEWKHQIKKEQTVYDLLNVFMFKAEVIKKVGMWDLLVPFMGEDGDFQARLKKQGYRIIINPKAITYHDIKYTTSRYFMRLTKMRMYHVMHSKILHEYRYDTIIGKITFSISIPIYLVYYIKKILFQKYTNNKISIISSLINGTIVGIKDALLNKKDIKWL